MLNLVWHVSAHIIQLECSYSLRNATLQLQMVIHSKLSLQHIIIDTDKGMVSSSVIIPQDTWWTQRDHYVHRVYMYT